MENKHNNAISSLKSMIAYLQGLNENYKLQSIKKLIAQANIVKNQIDAYKTTMERLSKKSQKVVHYEQ